MYNNLFKYEMHTHTIEGSRCSRISAYDLVHYYKDNGYDGICISDHFTGSTTVPEGTNWNDRIYLFAEGYRKAKEEGDKIGLDVFFALEYSYGGTDFLFLKNDCYEWLLANPDMLTWKPSDIFKKFRQDGGFISQAHPFMEARYIDHIRLFPRDIDAVEVINGGKEDILNERALFYAKTYDLARTAGTDCHHNEQKNMTAVLCEKKCEYIEDLANQIKARTTKVYSQRHGLDIYND